MRSTRRWRHWVAPLVLVGAVGLVARLRLSPSPSRHATSLRTSASSTGETHVAVQPSAPGVSSVGFAAPALTFLAERDAAYAVIAALQRQGSYPAAAEWACRSRRDMRRDLVIAAFHEWGRHEPGAAFAAAVAVEVPADRDLAIDSVFSGWARNDPAGLAAVALRFPPGPERQSALMKAMREWMHVDPWTAGDWILAQDDSVRAIAERLFATENR